MATASATKAINSIPVPPPLKLHTGELPANWRRFKSQRANYELATDVKAESKEKRTTILLSCIRSDAYDVFQSLVLDDLERSDINAVL